MRPSKAAIALLFAGWVFFPDFFPRFIPRPSSSLGPDSTAGRVIAQDFSSQKPGSTDPIVGLRDNVPGIYALENIDIVVRPGKRIEAGTILIRNGAIIAAGKDVDVPETAERLDRSGHVAYAGLIDAYSEVEVVDPSRDAGAPHWNGNVMPQRAAASVAAEGIFDGKKLRSQGITIRLLAPEGGIVKGTSCLVLTGDGASGELLLDDSVFQHLALTVPRRRGGGRDSYPNSPMGAVALLRQTLLDAQWYADALDAYKSNGKLPRPSFDIGLETLVQAKQTSKFVVDAPNERMALRAQKLANEFSLDIILHGSGREYRQLAEIAGIGKPMLIPVDFADAPKINSESDARETSLQELLDWELAPSNPARLAEAGVTFCLTTDGLSDAEKFLEQVRKAVDAGLDADVALAAITTTPASLLGIADWAGSIESGKLANLVVTDGDLFKSGTKTIETWVAGEQYVVTEPEKTSLKSIEGAWVVSGKLETEEPDETESLKLVLKKKGSGMSGTLSEIDDEEDSEESDAEDKADDEEKPADDEADGDDEEGEKPVDLTKVTRERDRLTAAVDLSKIDDDFAAGISWITILTTDTDEGIEVVDAFVTLPSGQAIKVDVSPFVEPETEETETEAAEEEAKEESSDEAEDANSEDEAEEGDSDSPDTDSGSKEEDSAADEDEADEAEPEDQYPNIDIVYPLGAYGLAEPIESKTAVVFRGATVWTCGDAGILEDTDVLIVDGCIEAIGVDLEVPEGCEEINVDGKHLTPGLIDCHSHMATDGGVNESGQTITAEVRIEDFIDNSDISIYRQLAGGLTTSNILHGSANPIGGQNQVIKLRWGGTMDEMLFDGAPKGIKFALGENVKRSSGRYPDTRMGVEQIVRDQFLAAQEYADAHRRYRTGDRSTLPPRVDLQLQAIAEILAGDRWIHCHSYRQDEIVALLDTLDEFGVQIGSLQHILEGYKVADRMAQHGATASSFSDWWAYKFEVWDAIPYNGALLHEAGIVVSFNSDDAELARHMNTEAAKAVKYGGVSPEEALKFVTLNPAKQLRIDDRVGSIEVGKDADLAVWSRQPLSTMTRCEQTWIDGRCYFSLDRDVELKARDAQWHAHLVQKALGGKGNATGARKERIEEEDRWHRHDIYCGHSGHGHEGESHNMSEDQEHMHLEEAGQ